MEENGIKFIAEEKEKTVAEEITHYQEESDRSIHQHGKPSKA